MFFDFYSLFIGFTFLKVVPRSSLEATLSDLHELSAKTFLSALHGHVRRLMAERGVADHPPASDLSASAGVAQLLALLRDVLNNGAVTGGAQKHLDKVKVIKSILFCKDHYFLYVK